MSSSSDLVENLVMDTSEFIAPVMDAADAMEGAGERIVRVIHEQQVSWTNMIAEIVPQITEFGLSIARNAVEAASHLREVAADCIPQLIGLSAGFLQIGAAAGQMGSVSGQLAGIAGAVATGGAAVVTATGQWGNLGQAALKYGGIASRVVGMVVPQWRIATAVIGTGLLAYNVATSDMAASAVRNTAKAVGANEGIQASWARLKTSVGNLGGILSQPFEDMQAGAVSLVSALNPIPTIVEYIAPVVASGMSAAANAVQSLENTAQEAADVFTTALYVSSSWGEATAESTQRFHEEAASLRAMAKETERVIALQEQQHAIFAQLGKIQEDASTAAEHAQHVATIGHMTKMEEIDAELRKQQELDRKAVQSGTFDPSRSRDIYNALARQREGVKSGDITEKSVKEKDNPVKGMLDQVQAQIDALRLGEDEAAIAAAKAKGATEEEIEKLRELYDQRKELKGLEEASKEAEKAAKENADGYKHGADQIQAMRDQVDLLSGAASKAELAMREAFRSGMAQEQIDEIGKLTEELDKLKEKKEKEPKENGAAGAGSQEAAKIVLRGVGGNSTDSKLDQQTNIQKQMLAELKKNQGNKAVKIKSRKA